LFVRVDARNFAPVKPAPLPAGPTVHDLKLGPGVVVAGKVVKDGKPLAGVALCLIQQERHAERVLGKFTISTDEQGVFAFVNVPPDRMPS
jgi:hypothetical protein